MTFLCLEEKLQAAGSAVKMMRTSQAGPIVRHVPAEFSNWRDEQVAWRETVALLDLTHHMTDLSMRGPDVIRLLSDLGINSFTNFQVNKAKQFVCCSPEGYVIGDGILFYLDRDHVSLLGMPAAHNWVQYHAQSGRYDVAIERDEPTAINPAGQRKLYRYQVQGPNALELLQKATAGNLPDIKFFNIGQLRIAGHAVRALRHGMSSAPGLEVFGPWEERDEVREALVEAGSDLGLRQVGYLAYPTTTLESGWISHPLPAIYTASELRAYREWLPATRLEAAGSLAGSFDSDEISDYYLTPYELGYGPFVKFDHDFIGRKALETMGEPRRRKVTLAWNADDVVAAMRTTFERGNAVKFFNLPYSIYGTWNCDKVLRKGGGDAGLSTVSGYSYNERTMLSLAVIDADIPIGTEVTLIWGEKNGGSPRPVVERHTQVEIRAVVSPCPYSEVARTTYAEGWRTAAVRT